MKGRENKPRFLKHPSVNRYFCVTEGGEGSGKALISMTSFMDYPLGFIPLGEKVYLFKRETYFLDSVIIFVMMLHD